MEIAERAEHVQSDEEGAEMPAKRSRWWLTEDSETVDIDAPAGEWSPECARVEWEAGATGPAVDARFVGHNRGGPFKLMRWSRHGRVLVAEPGCKFAFATEEGGREGTVWRYRFEAADSGTRVTESYHVDWIPLWARIVDVPTNRAKELREAMRHTLGHLKTAAEASSTRRQHT